jgi:hypothetical protein
MATKDSRPVREEVVDKVSVGSLKEPVVFRGRSRSREAFPVATPGEAHVSKPSGDVEFPPRRRDNRDSLCPVPGCGMWTRKMKDHAFKVYLSPFFQIPARVTGVDKLCFVSWARHWRWSGVWFVAHHPVPMTFWIWLTPRSGFLGSVVFPWNVHWP